MMFQCVTDIDKYWLTARNILKPAFCGVFQIDSIDDYYSPLVNGQAQLWLASDEEIHGAVITSIDKGSQGSVLSVRYLGGRKLRQWAKVMDTNLTAFAKANNCLQIQAVTRSGFSRFVPTFKAQKLQLFVKVL